MSQQNLEERVAALEEEVKRLKSRVNTSVVSCASCKGGGWEIMLDEPSHFPCNVCKGVGSVRI
jgi:DnaJ-class molecular chaperone